MNDVLPLALPGQVPRDGGFEFQKKKKPATGYGVNSVTFGDEVLKNRSRAGNLDGILPGKLLKNKKTQTGEYNDGCVKTF